MNPSPKLSNDEINRYSRQIILPHVGVPGQVTLKTSSVLVVGAGGLGCPCALYLAGAGVGHIGIVDHDQVELNNLHRQVLHKESSIGENKVDSAKNVLTSFNSGVKVTTFQTELNSGNAFDVIKEFDIVVDCTDNVATRYLLNDACFLKSKPLVSGSALQMEGQLTVYNSNGPCYRCLFPVPPHPSTVTSCGEGGVLGVIPGTIGVLQALQVLNMLLGKPFLSGEMLLFDGIDCSFRRIKLRRKLQTCALCGEKPTITGLIDYEQFCQAKATDKNPNLHLLGDHQRITTREYVKLRDDEHLLVDVRSSQEFAICSLPGSLNIPIRSITSDSAKEKLKLCLNSSANNDSKPVIVVCRRGNDSQKAVLALEEQLGIVAKDIIGGLHAWTAEVDPTFPVY